MKVTYKTANGRMTFEFESENDKTLAASLAQIQEIFEEPACGCCHSDRIRFDVREFDGNTYYKLFCTACGATMDFGQHKTGDSLFAKRYEKDTREPLANRGWYIYKNAAQKPTAPANGERTNGTPANGRPQAPAAPQRPAAAASNGTTAKRRYTPSEAHALIIKEYDAAETELHAMKWKEWGRNNFKFAPAQEEEQGDAWHAMLERLGLAEPPPVGVVDDDIPF